MIIVEQVQPSRDRGFLPELPCTGSPVAISTRLGAPRCEGLDGRRIPFGSMEASQWAVDLCSVI
jgi:hypothetical protein